MKITCEVKGYICIIQRFLSQTLLLSNPLRILLSWILLDTERGNGVVGALIRWEMEDSVCDAYLVTKCGNSGLHGHHHFLLTLIINGTGIQRINGKDISFRPGDLFVLSPADFHQNIVEEGKSFDYYGVKFFYDLLDPELAELCSPDLFPIYIHLSDKSYTTARSLFELLVEEMQYGKERAANRVYLRGLINHLFILMLRQIPAKNNSSSDTSFNRVLGFLYSHFHENISVRDAAACMGYTTNYFNTRFRQVIGIPFGMCLRQIRLEYAKKCLPRAICQ